MGPDTEQDPQMKELVATENAAGLRIDQWLAGELAPDFSRARVKALMEAGHITLNARPAIQPKVRIAPGDVCRITLPPPEPAMPEAENMALDILFEDDDLIVINKPAGLVVHPGAGNPSGTLVNALLHHCGNTLSGIGGVMRPGIVHRLDKDTSGVMVVAKNDRSHRALSEAFADHGRTAGLERAYTAIVWGAPERTTGVINAPLGRATADRTRKAVVNEGRPDARHAVTHYRVLEKFGRDASGQALASCVECRLETGRTHQIRVHMAHIGHPLIGDQAYGRAFATKANLLTNQAAEIIKNFGRQALHAHLLAFQHPVTGNKMRFRAPPPDDFVTVKKALAGAT
jgi:23S rRNA pseudouridine1911/1915/1917 synthase